MGSPPSPLLASLLWPLAVATNPLTMLPRPSPHWVTGRPIQAQSFWTPSGLGLVRVYTLHAACTMLHHILSCFRMRCIIVTRMPEMTRRMVCVCLHLASMLSILPGIVAPLWLQLLCSLLVMSFGFYLESPTACFGRCVRDGCIY